jgi:hypothetical protein
VSSTAFGQGIVHFANNPSTLVSYWNWRFNSAYSSGLISGTSSWYFALLTGPTANGPFVFSGVYATNNATAPGRFVNNGVSVPGWAAGTFRWYQVAGWHSSLGPTFNPGWLVSPPAGFATSQTGLGIAAGMDSFGRPYPPLPLFGGTGISSGFKVFFDPSLILISLSTGGVRFGFNINGPGTGVIEASTNLADPGSWIELQTLTNAFYFTDPEWRNYPNRFYRMRSL